jgi:hypothetical protein
MMVSLREELQDERRRLQARLDAVDLVLVNLAVLYPPDVASPHTATGRHRGAAAKAGRSRCGECAAAILAYLSKLPASEGPVDGKTLRRAVAQQMRVSSDPRFASHVRNALTRLKAQKRITKTGKAWSLLPSSAKP